MSQHVLITGATDGIGLELARRYHTRGARLVLIGRRALDELDEPCFSTSTYCRVDLADIAAPAIVAQFLQTHAIQTLDLLIHNAAIGYYGSLEQQTAANTRQLIAVDLRAPIALTHQLLPQLNAARGKLVFISSVAAALPTPDYAVYGAAKAALDGFVRNLRVELRGRVAVQLIVPGATRTTMHLKSGAPLDKLGWQRFPSAGAVAEQIVRAIDRGRATTTIGLSNQLLRFGGRHLSWLVDRLVVRNR